MTTQDLAQIDKLLQKRFKSFADKELSNFATKDDLKRFATKDDLERFATKDDLKRELSRYATRNDLERFATKDDLEKELSKYATKEDLENTLSEAVTTILEAVDNKKADRKEVQSLDQRLTILESKQN